MFQAVALLIMFTVSLTWTLTASKKNSTCPTDCICTDMHVSCSGFIPASVPSDTKMITLSHIDSADLFPDRFCHMSWKNVTKLIFASVIPRKLAEFELDGGVFSCLHTIVAFKFKSEFLTGFSSFAFSGLTNVVSFDLSGCKKIHWMALYKTLITPLNLPKMESLILSGTGTHETLNLDQNFINAIGMHPVAYMDLSFTSFRFDFTKPGKFCNKLKSLNYAGAQTDFSTAFCKIGECQSLRYLNIDESVAIRNFFKNTSCVYRTKHFSLLPFFTAVRVISLNRIITASEKFSMFNCSLVLFANTSVNEFRFAYNYFPDFDTELVNNRLRIADLSHNQIENINPNALKHLKS